MHELETKVHVLESQLDLMRNQREDRNVHQVHTLELDLKQRDDEIAFLRGELQQATASLAQASRDREDLITEEMGQKHSDTMLKVIKQERDDLTKKLQHAKERLGDLDALKRERATLLAQKDQQVVEIKGHYEQQRQLKEEIFALKEKLQTAKATLA